MSGQQRLPIELDPFRMAEQGRQFSSPVRIKQFKRLLPLLESDEGNVDVELQFEVDEIGMRILRGHLKANLILQCQRCLAKMDYPLESDFHLAIIQSDGEVERLPETYEPLVVESTPMHVLDVIEDEILLSIPQVPMHGENDCIAQPTKDKTELAEQHANGETKENPFAVLEKLKKDH
ncbi:MAG: YceD family protein [Gammaproteobacteria bacterium]|nr:YceD family protein [Gammaproteobacteria bacterium]